MLNDKPGLDPFLSEITEAKQANKAKTEFLSNMSHEIRTPLNVIIGMCDIAKHHIDDQSKVEECLRKISIAGDNLIELVNSVLDITKIEQGQVSMKEQQFNIDDLVDEVKALIEPCAASKSIILEISAKEVVNKNIVSDYAHVMRVMINLATNAVKYTPQGGFVKIFIKEMKNPCRGMTTYRFTCQDNGIGMSDELLEHIFEPFVRSEDIRVSRINGSGLGMSIVKKVVDLLGGSIDIKSAEGAGTSVTVAFDFKIAEVGKIIKDIDEFKRQQLKQLEERKIILIAEDIKSNQEILITYLEDMGYEADVAENGEEVVDMFIEAEEGFYKAVILDIEMPVMDGYQATLLIRGLNRRDNDVPIIAMTANAFETDRNKAKQVGMNDYLTKPLKMDDLRQILESRIKSSS